MDSFMRKIKHLGKQKKLELIRKKIVGKRIENEQKFQRATNRLMIELVSSIKGLSICNNWTNNLPHFGFIQEAVESETRSLRVRRNFSKNQKKFTIGLTFCSFRNTNGRKLKEADNTSKFTLLMCCVENCR